MYVVPQGILLFSIQYSDWEMGKFFDDFKKSLNYKDTDLLTKLEQNGY